MDLFGIVELLKIAYGPRGWWPLPSRALRDGRDAGGYLPLASAPIGPGGNAATQAARFEIAVGAVLAQNTAWRGASKAVFALSAAGLMTPASILAAELDALAGCIRPAGTYRRKALYLKELAAAWPLIESEARSRDTLLSLRGIGHETADCIMLYCYGQPLFVADAYARRILSRLGFVGNSAGYEKMRAFAESVLPVDAPYLAEAHALLVEHAKRACSAKPHCDACALMDYCLVSRSMVTGPSLT